MLQLCNTLCYNSVECEAVLNRIQGRAQLFAICSDLNSVLLLLIPQNLRKFAVDTD